MAVMFTEVEGNVVQVCAAFSHATLKPPEKMLTMAFNNHLERPSVRCLQNHIREPRLDGWVQMDFRLLKEHG